MVYPSFIHFVLDHTRTHCVETTKTFHTWLQVMIAEEASKRQGLGQEALRLLMSYAIVHLKVSRFRAKIGYANIPSQNLFQKLGFHEVKRVEVFQEVHLELDHSSCTAVWEQLCGEGTLLKMSQYDKIGSGSTL